MKRCVAALVFSTCMTTGSVVREPCFHAGFRPASSWGEGAGATAQFSFDVPCTERQP